MKKYIEVKSEEDMRKWIFHLRTLCREKQCFTNDRDQDYFDTVSRIADFIYINRDFLDIEDEEWLISIIEEHELDVPMD